MGKRKEGLQFVNENSKYADFLSKLDTESITKHVTRVADANEGSIEASCEKRMLRMKLKNNKDIEKKPEVDVSDVRPVKIWLESSTVETCLRNQKKPKEDSKEAESVGGLVKLTKPEKHAKLKKLRKEAKKQGKEEEVQQTPQAQVLDEVKKDLTAEETSERKKYKFAELGTALLADPESNIKHVKEMLELSKDADSAIVILGLKSLLAVLKDIIPGYRIRLPSEKEQEMKVSKTVTKTRFYESTCKAYVQKLYHYFWESLLVAVVRNISSQDEIVSAFWQKTLLCNVKSLFTNEGKHGGEVTVEAVRMIAELVKIHNCLLHPDSVEVFCLFHLTMILENRNVHKWITGPKTKLGRRERVQMSKISCQIMRGRKIGKR